MSFQIFIFFLTASFIVLTMTKYIVKFDRNFTRLEFEDIEKATTLSKRSINPKTSTADLVKIFSNWVDDDNLMCTMNDDEIKKIIPLIYLVGREILTRERRRKFNPLYEFAISFNPEITLNINSDIQGRFPKLIAIYNGRYTCKRFLTLSITQ